MKQPTDWDDAPHRSKKKDTRKWCLGKVGRLHQNEWHIWKGWVFPYGDRSTGTFSWWIETCTVCGRNGKMVRHDTGSGAPR